MRKVDSRPAYCAGPATRAPKRGRASSPNRKAFPTGTRRVVATAPSWASLGAARQAEAALTSISAGCRSNSTIGGSSAGVGGTEGRRRISITTIRIATTGAAPTALGAPIAFRINGVGFGTPTSLAAASPTQRTTARARPASPSGAASGPIRAGSPTSAPATALPAGRAIAIRSGLAQRAAAGGSEERATCTRSRRPRPPTGRIASARARSVRGGRSRLGPTSGAWVRPASRRISRGPTIARGARRPAAAIPAPAVGFLLATPTPTTGAPTPGAIAGSSPAASDPTVTGRGLVLALRRRPRSRPQPTYRRRLEIGRGVLGGSGARAVASTSGAFTAPSGGPGTADATTSRRRCPSTLGGAFSPTVAW